MQSCAEVPRGTGWINNQGLKKAEYDVKSPYASAQGLFLVAFYQQKPWIVITKGQTGRR
jgi:hypothetical protein